MLTPLLLAMGCKSSDSNDGGAGSGSQTGGQGGETGGAPECNFGSDPAKCGSDALLACAPLLGDPGKDCERDDDCDGEELCFLTKTDSSSGVCRRILGSCQGVGAQGSGKGFGDSCDPDASIDKCAGTCVPIGTDGEGECEETCRVGASRGCGEDSLAGKTVGCAFFAYDLEDAGIEQGIGDLGICAAFCQCNDDCPGNQLCFDNPFGDYAGICAGGIADEDAVAVCPTDGSGGAGGMIGTAGVGGKED